MEQNHYQNPAGMPQPNGQMPYGSMPYPQQNMPQGTPYPNQPGFNPGGNMNMPPRQMPQGQIPQGQMPGGQLPQGQIPQGQIPGGQIPQGQQPSAKQKKSAKKAEKKALNKKKWITLGIFCVIGLVLGILIFSVTNHYVKQVTVIDLPGAPVVASGKETGVDVDRDGIIDIYDNNDSLDISKVTVQKGQAWDGKNRITCLAMGLDYRDWLANDGAPRSDSMMLLTYDPETQYSGMLSIPRDLWVAIPDHGYGRINTAYSMGEAEQLPGVNGKPGGGPGLAMRTVELFLGVEIQYYAVIDFYGFIEFIDTIDKLAINVRDDITVDPLGEGNTVHLMAGVQDLDGATALAYARYRYTGGGDFERAQRQQDVIFAIYEQLQWQLPELLATKSDELFSCIQRAVKTNLTLPDIVKLGWTIVDLDSWYISRAVIAPPEQVLYETTPDGQSILIPIPDRIREARDSIYKHEFGSGNVLTGEYTKEQRLQDEGATIMIVNGSTVAGIAEQTAQWLQQYGIKVASIAGGTTGYMNALEVRKGTPYTAKFLQEMMSIPTGAVTWNIDPNSDVDLVVTITDAWAGSNPM